jgi:hypothetical protein
MRYAQYTRATARPDKEDTSIGEGDKAKISEVERLIDLLVKTAERTPFFVEWTGHVWLKESTFYDLCNQIRETIPDGIKRALDILEREDNILKNAQDEHKRIIDTAQRARDEMVAQEEVFRLAKERAEKIIEDATREAAEIRTQAVDYIDKVLGELEVNLANAATTVKASRKALDDTRQEDVPSP